jgi:hypothetical protein
MSCITSASFLTAATAQSFSCLAPSGNATLDRRTSQTRNRKYSLEKFKFTCIIMLRTMKFLFRNHAIVKNTYIFVFGEQKKKKKRKKKIKKN